MDSVPNCQPALHLLSSEAASSAGTKHEWCVNTCRRRHQRWWSGISCLAGAAHLPHGRVPPGQTPGQQLQKDHAKGEDVGGGAGLVALHNLWRLRGGCKGCAAGGPLVGCIVPLAYRRHAGFRKPATCHQKCVQSPLPASPATDQPLRVGGAACARRGAARWPQDLGQVEVADLQQKKTGIGYSASMTGAPPLTGPPARRAPSSYQPPLAGPHLHAPRLGNQQVGALDVAVDQTPAVQVEQAHGGVVRLPEGGRVRNGLPGWASASSNRPSWASQQPIGRSFQPEAPAASRRCPPYSPGLRFPPCSGDGARSARQPLRASVAPLAGSRRQTPWGSTLQGARLMGLDQGVAPRRGTRHHRTAA